MRYTIEIAGETTAVEVRPVGPGRYWVRVGETAPGRVVNARVDAAGVHLLDGPLSQRVLLGGDDARRDVALGGHTTRLAVLDPQAARVRAMRGASGVGGGDNRVVSPMPGRIVKVQVAEGDTVVVGQGVVIVEAMKMENELRAGVAGVVKTVRCAAGDLVEGGAELVVIEPAAAEPA